VFSPFLGCDTGSGTQFSGWIIPSDIFLEGIDCRRLRRNNPLYQVAKGKILAAESENQLVKSKKGFLPNLI
jgi:hypothetical protein